MTNREPTPEEIAGALFGHKRPERQGIDHIEQVQQEGQQQQETNLERIEREHLEALARQRQPQDQRPSVEQVVEQAGAPFKQQAKSQAQVEAEHNAVVAAMLGGRGQEVSIPASEFGIGVSKKAGD